MNSNSKTPKELMKSRYDAFVNENWEYLAKTSLHQTIEDLQDSPYINWLKLDVITAYDNVVEFKAYYKIGHKIEVLHEKSTFVKDDGIWKYKDGEMFDSIIQRNETCPCGSGKKFKRCCA